MTINKCVRTYHDTLVVEQYNVPTTNRGLWEMLTRVEKQIQQTGSTKVRFITKTDEYYFFDSNTPESEGWHFLKYVLMDESDKRRDGKQSIYDVHPRRDFAEMMAAILWIHNRYHYDIEESVKIVLRHTSYNVSTKRWHW